MSRFFRRGKKQNQPDEAYRKYPEIPGEAERVTRRQRSDLWLDEEIESSPPPPTPAGLSSRVRHAPSEGRPFGALGKLSRKEKSPERKATLYPWSHHELTYSPDTTARPFPRYGAAVPPLQTKEGDIYVMGGLVNASTVKGDLWIVERDGLECSPVRTTHEGPGPRVGHVALVVGNAFIVHGGDTKVDETDVLDETLYLLNTATRQWSRALPSGPRPAGRYGHTLNLLDTKIYIFGGQEEGSFKNDLAAFDLNELTKPSNQWELLKQNGPTSKWPAARTNHTMVTFQDKMYLFGGTDGLTWYNDTWCYDRIRNEWSELDCVGYIPYAREGHAAVVVDDVMYMFGGRTEEGQDLGDLAAFRIPSRRWYTFQNMGPSPSPRSGHSMTASGKSILVMGGEPSSAGPDQVEFSRVYILDTKKIRYPPQPEPETQNADRAADSGASSPLTEILTEEPVVPNEDRLRAFLGSEYEYPVNADSAASSLPDKDSNVPSRMETYDTRDMETYYGNVQTFEDAVLLFEACRLGFLAHCSRALSPTEQQSIRHGSVFIWDESMVNLTKWPDGKLWGPPQVSGFFVICHESASNDLRRLIKPQGLTKQSVSLKTREGRRLHLVSYYNSFLDGHFELKQPCTDPALRNIPQPLEMHERYHQDWMPVPLSGVEQPPSEASDSSSNSGSSAQDKSLFSGPGRDAQSTTETVPTSYMASTSAAASRPGDKPLSGEITQPGFVDIPEELDPDDGMSDDGRSLFSMGSRGLPPSIDGDVSRIIERLVTDSPALHGNLDFTSQEKLWQALPELLKAFAVKFGYGDQAPHRREIMFFVRQYRISLAARLRGHLADLDSGSQVASSLDGSSESSASDDFDFQPPEPGMTVDEKMEQLWSGSTKFEPVENENVEDTTNLPEIEESPSMNAEDIKNSVAYTWLLGALSAEATSMVVGTDARTQIRESILNFLWSQERKRGPKKFRPRARAQEHHVLLVLDWDPIAFLKSEGWDGTKNASTVLGATLTLTGSSTDCQALTTEGYLVQTWPSTGHIVMEFIGLVMSDNSGGWQSVTLPDQAILEGRLVSGQMSVNIKGSAPSVSEVAEQLVWMGCALRPSLQKSTLSYCTYSLSRQAGNARFMDSESKMPDHSFRISFDLEPLPGHAGENQCWHSMFLNPTIARGFPIKRRVKQSSGLEIPLGIMAQMVRATQFVIFNAAWYLKGFSSFLALTEHRDDELLWHHVFKQDGSYASFSDFDGASSFGLNTSQLQKSRHIIGWCQKAELRAGAIPGGEFEGGPSKLRRPHATCVLKEATLTAGFNVNAQAMAEIGVRTQPLHLATGGDYWVKINKVRQHYFLLWDEASKRGWLINGASAMLHLLLTRIQYDITQGRKLAFPAAGSGDPSTQFRHWKSQLKLPADPYSSAAARSILENESNKSLPIFIPGDDFRRETRSFVTLFDEVNDMFSVLEQIFEHESIVRHRNGVDIKPVFRPRKHLEGWDFVDIAERRPDPVYPRLKELPQMGKCWVDFTRGINASTLFARGFGELIEPTPGSEVCSALARLPTGQNFLAVCASDMKEILRMYSIEDDDEVENGPTEVLEGLFWVHSHDPFKSCHGKGRAGADCCDATQVLAPKPTLSKLWRWGNNDVPHVPIDLEGRGASGAIYFGFTRNRPVYYLDEGEPSLEPPEVVPTRPVEHKQESRRFQSDSLAPSSTSGFSTSLSDGGTTNAASTLLTESTSMTGESLRSLDKPDLLPPKVRTDSDSTVLRSPPTAPSKKKSGLNARMGKIAGKFKLKREAK